jgi:hypothetical protein
VRLLRVTYRRAGAREIVVFCWAGIPLFVLQVGVDHLLDQLPEVNCRMPAQFGMGLGRVTDQDRDIGGPEETLVLDDVRPPVIYSDMLKCNLKQVSDRMALAGGDDIVVGFLLLKHEPHRLNVVTSEAPVPGHIHVAHRQNLLTP